MENEIVIAAAGKDRGAARYNGVYCAMILVPDGIIPEEPEDGNIPEGPEEDNHARITNGVLYVEGNCSAEIDENVLTVHGNCSATISGNVLFVN